MVVVKGIGVKVRLFSWEVDGAGGREAEEESDGAGPGGAKAVGSGGDVTVGDAIEHASDHDGYCGGRAVREAMRLQRNRAVVVTVAIQGDGARDDECHETWVVLANDHVGARPACRDEVAALVDGLQEATQERFGGLRRKPALRRRQERRARHDEDVLAVRFRRGLKVEDILVEDAMVRNVEVVGAVLGNLVVGGVPPFPFERKEGPRTMERVPDHRRLLRR
mmetsp:Transcript_3087/g.9426  ORF Transcript_3087/g.9426 Transcript_3087/m.9426 type:complete len:222 (+) Transcript_3087:209-874(+)